jgi:hypothetical protein
MFSSRQQRSSQELEVLKQRYNFILKLTRDDLMAGKFEKLFPYTSKRVKWSLQIEGIQHVSLGHYISFLSAFNTLYKLMLTIIKPEYFVSVWLSKQTKLFHNFVDEVYG